MTTSASFVFANDRAVKGLRVFGRPKASFYVTGKTGYGKTYMAQAMMAAMQSGRKPYVIDFKNGTTHDILNDELPSLTGESEFGEIVIEGDFIPKLFDKTSAFCAYKVCPINSDMVGYFNYRAAKLSENLDHSQWRDIISAVNNFVVLDSAAYVGEPISVLSAIAHNIVAQELLPDISMFYMKFDFVNGMSLISTLQERMSPKLATITQLMQELESVVMEFESNGIPIPLDLLESMIETPYDAHVQRMFASTT